MIRITAGRLKGRQLKTPKGDKTRPTDSRVREAVFNILGQSLDGLWFYDLFAGSGAMGFEALSRGADGVVFVEAFRQAQLCLQYNFQMLECGPDCRLHSGHLPSWLESKDFKPLLPACFFLDPPYREGLADQTMKVLGRVIAAYPAGDCEGSVCAAQTEKNAPLLEQYGPWTLRKKYNHGDTALFVYDWTREAPDAPTE